MREVGGRGIVGSTEMQHAPLMVFLPFYYQEHSRHNLNSQVIWPAYDDIEPRVKEEKLKCSQHCFNSGKLSNRNAGFQLNFYLSRCILEYMARDF